MVELNAKQRSKTAPTSLADVPLNAASGGKSAIPGTKVNMSGRRSVKIALPDMATMLELETSTRTNRSPLMTPKRTDVEDPFSLTGFFPSHPGSPSSAHPVAWATGEFDEDDPETQPEETGRVVSVQKHVHMAESEESGTSGGVFTLRKTIVANSGAGIVPNRSLSMGALDEYAREVIDKESHVGIMGLARVPSFLRGIKFGSGWGAGDLKEEESGEEEEEMEVEEDSEGEWRIYDEETLLERMHARRTASERELAGLVDREGGGWGLFTRAE